MTDGPEEETETQNEDNLQERDEEEEEEDLENEEDYDEGDDFRFRKRMRGGFRHHGGMEDGYMDRYGPGPRFPPRGRGYGPGGPPGRFRGPPPNWGRGGRGPRFGGGGWRGDDWGDPRNNWGPPGYNGPPGMMGPPGMGPPHMMGPPPGGPMGMGPGYGPMGCPPNMGPPMDMSGEIWVETKSPEGKAYYYHAQTRETTWTKPEGPTVKILTQEQVEQMASGMMNGPPMGMGGPMMGPGGMIGPGGMMGPDGMMNQQGNFVGPKTSGKKDDTPGGTPGQGSDDDASRSPTSSQQQHQQQPIMGGGGGGGGNAYMGQGYGGMPGGFPQFPGMQWGQGMGMPVTSQPNDPSKVVTSAPATKPDDLSQIDPEIVAKAAEWSEHKAPDGRPYFYNAKAAESVWEKPQALKDLETAKLAAAQGISTLPSAVANVQPMVNTMQQAQLQQKSIADDDDSSDSSDDEEDRRRAEMEKKMQEKRLMEEEAKQREEEERQNELKKQQDKARPVTSQPVPGTPWCVVWTGDGRVFFYNPSTRTSVWERPEDLAGRADVDKLVSTPTESIIAGGTGGVTSVSNTTTTTTTTSTSLNNNTNTPNKRDNNMDTSDEEESPPPKKAKNGPPVKEQPAPMKMAGKIDIGKEAAIEAEVRAARERAIIPLDQRIKSFKEMLAEKEVSAFSTWEKELHKIVFDSRYLLLTSKERKQVFEKYVKERAEEERREKRNKMKERKEDFRRLMESANLHGKSSFSDFASKYGKDDRFKNIEKMRERESLFNEYLLDVRKKEKEEKIARREQIKKEYFQLLRETADLDHHARYSDFKKKISSDVRYKAVESSTAREDWFREHVKQLKDERKRDKEKDKREKKDERKKDEKKKEKRDTSRGEEEDGMIQEPSESDRDVTNSDDEKEKELKDKEKQARMEASLREREKEVQRTLATHLRDRDKEREHHKRDEAVQHFNALLADLVRNADLSWKEAKRIVRKDSRWDMAELLEREDKEKLFNSHIEQLTLKKREKFRELLDETEAVTLTSSWKEIKKLIKEDPRYTKFSSSERKLEREFKDYIKDKYVAAKADFRELLQETKLITHNSLKLLQENEQHIHEIEDILKKDKRYLVLDYVPEERTKLIFSYLEDLEKRGPPPPPTASEPNRRTK